MKNLLLLAALCLCFPAFAQVQQILMNPDVTWAGYVEQDFHVEGEAPQCGDLNEIIIQKIQPRHPGDIIWESEFLKNKVVESILDGNIPIYADPGKANRIYPNEIRERMDTMILFDPETYEDKITVVRKTFIQPKDIRWWRLHGLLYYNNKTAQWGLSDVSLAPIVPIWDEANSSIELGADFWMGVSTEAPPVKNKDLVWAKWLVPKDGKALICLDSARVLKSTDAGPMRQMVDALYQRPDVDFLSPSQYGGGAIMTADEKKMVSWLETEPDLEAIPLRLETVIAWDDKRKQLYLHANAAAPMMKVEVRSGLQHFYTPLFYRKCKN